MVIMLKVSYRPVMVMIAFLSTTIEAMPISLDLASSAKECAEASMKSFKATGKCADDEDGPASNCVLTLQKADQLKMNSLRDNLANCLVRKGMTERSSKEGYDGFMKPGAGGISFVQIRPWKVEGAKATLQVDIVW
jgi:hypothetical protein